MNALRLAVAAASILFSVGVAAEPEAPPMSASELAARLSANQRDGASYIRLRLTVKQPGGTKALQLQVKSRNTKAATEVSYQVLWPGERKGEAVLLRQAAGRPATGSLFFPPDTVRPLDASQMKDAFFGSDLSYEDVIDNCFAWEHQAIVGTEVVNRVSCVILESKPGKNEGSSYARVRAWVDVRRLIPLRIEKYLASGRLARRIETTKVATDDRRRPVPANLTVQGLQESIVTEVDGSRIRHDVTYSDREFTPHGLKEVTTPQFAPE